MECFLSVLMLGNGVFLVLKKADSCRRQTTTTTKGIAKYIFLANIVYSKIQQRDNSLNNFI